MKLHRGKRTDTDTKHSVLHIQAGQASDYGQQALRIYGVQECYGVLVRTERALMPDKRRLRSCLVWGPESSSCTLCFLQGHECTEYKSSVPANACNSPFIRYVFTYQARILPHIRRTHYHQGLESDWSDWVYQEPTTENTATVATPYFFLSTARSGGVLLYIFLYIKAEK